MANIVVSQVNQFPFIAFVVGRRVLEVNDEHITFICFEWAY
jgi:hypothetical protein